MVPLPVDLQGGCSDRRIAVLCISVSKALISGINAGPGGVGSSQVVFL